ncbi:MAG TPA: 4Fe-4S dicluster domain-containing protein [Tepidisphaeraceae bacterium]
MNKTTDPSPASARSAAGTPGFRDLPIPGPGDPAALAPVTDRQFIRDTLARLEPSELPAILDRLSAGNINADRWESPDLLEQLRQAARRPAKAVVCGAIDLDPALPFMRTLAAERAMDIAAGAAALGKLAGTDRVILAVPEDMSPGGIAALRSAADAAEIRLFPLAEEYPLAHPSLLIRRVTGRRLAPGKLPTEIGVVMLDAPAAIAVGRFLVHGESMQRIPAGVYDGAAGRAHLVWTTAAITLDSLLSALKVSASSTELWAGHILRHVPIARDAILGSAELTFFASPPHAGEAAAACLRCGWCVEACPVNIHPAGLLDAAQLQDPALADAHGLRACIECGICSYVCPSRLPLLQSIRGMRKQ